MVYCGDLRTMLVKWKEVLSKHEVDVPYLEQLRSNENSNYAVP